MVVENPGWDWGWLKMNWWELLTQGNEVSIQLRRDVPARLNCIYIKCICLRKSEEKQSFWLPLWQPPVQTIFTPALLLRDVHTRNNFTVAHHIVPHFTFCWGVVAGSITGSECLGSPVITFTTFSTLSCKTAVSFPLRILCGVTLIAEKNPTSTTLCHLE